MLSPTPTAQKNPGTAQETPGQTTEPSQNTQKPERPVEPTVQDPSVTVPIVPPVENTQEFMNGARSELTMAIMKASDVEGVDPDASYPIPAEDCEPEGYKIFMQVIQEAKAMLEATNQAVAKDNEWSLVFDPGKGTFVNKQREFDPANYPYTATELLQEAAKVKAYREQKIVIQVEQVLTYYPEQSKAIFDAINEYRVSKGVEPLIWSENASKVSRLEAGYAAYIYKGTDDEEDLTNFEMHHMSQLGCTKVAGLIGVNEAMQAWINSPVWHEPWLRDPQGVYGSVAYYTYNSATTGVTWSKIVFTSWSRDDVGIYTHAPEEAWPTLLNCEINNTVIP